jgi:hypothetical protein
MPLSKRILPHGKKSINATSPNYYTATGTLDGNNILTGTTNSGSKTWTANLSALAGGGGVTSPLTTKGDIWVFGTANTRLAVGSNGQVLKADSGEALGLKWAAPTDTPAGSNQEIQYNADGSFGAIPTFKYDGSNINQTIGNFNLIPSVGNSSMNITGSLNVSGTGGADIVLRNDDATSPNTVLIRNDDDNATIRWQPKSGGAPTYTTTSGNFWAVGPSHTIGNNEHLVYDLANERLGIGIDIPAYNLDVIGTTRLSGNTLITGTLTTTGISTLADASTLASSAAPTTDAQIANKKYVDDSISTETPGGSTTQLQYNNNGAFGGVDDWTWNGSNMTIGTGSKLVFGDGLRYIDENGAHLRIRNSETGGDIQLNAKNDMSFYIDGAQKMHIDTSGKVGVGLTNPQSFSDAFSVQIDSNSGWPIGFVNAAEDVKGGIRTDQADNYIAFASKSESDIRFFYNDAEANTSLIIAGSGANAGNVGIGGTTNPSYPLHVMQGGNTYGMYMFNNGSKGIYFGDTNNNGTGYGKIGGVGGSLFLGSTQVYTSLIGTGDANTTLGSSGRRWSYFFARYGQFGYSTSDDENSGSGGYVLGVSGNADRHPFMVKAYGDEGVPSLIVTSGSNVGIGTATPLYPLQVMGAIALGVAGNSYTGDRITGATGKVQIIANGGTQATFDGTGLGIGTTGPNAKLDVLGSAKIGSSSYTTISDNEYDVSSGDLLFDVAGDITLDAGGQDIKLSTAGGNKASFYLTASDVYFGTKASDGDFIITGSDGGSQITALSFDMSEAGLATFNTTPVVGTMTSSDNSTKAASTAYVTTAVAAQGGGDVYKVGTPVDNQIGVWTGDGTIEGNANFTFTSDNRLDIVPSNAEAKIFLGAGNVVLAYTGSTGKLNSANRTLLLGNSGAEIKMLNGTNDSMHFYTNGSSTTGTERLTILSGGNVGIGTTLPSTALDVIGAIKNSSYIHQDADSSSTGVIVGAGGDANVSYDGTDMKINSQRVGSGDLHINATGGNVGIGTTDPIQPLHVLTSANDKGILIDVGDDAHEGRLLFGDTSSNAIGSLAYNHAMETMRFTVGGYETVRMANDGSYSKLFLGADSTLGLYRYSNRMDFYISSNPRMHLDASKLYSATSGGPLLDLTPTGGEANYGFYGDQNTGMSRSAADTLHLLTAGVSGMTMNATQGVGIGVVAPNTLRQGQGLTISGTAITSTAFTSSTHKKVTSLFAPSLGSGSYILAGIGGRDSQMGNGRAEPPLMVIGDVGTSLHQTTMNSGRAVSLVLAGTAGYNSGGQDYGNFGSLLFHGNSNWSGNSRRWLVTNAWRRSGAGDMGLGFASETSASLDPTVSGSIPSVVMSNDANYGTAGKGGLLVGNTSHIGTGKVTILDADNGVPLTLAWDGSHYTTFGMNSGGDTVIKSHHGQLALETATGGERIRLDSKGDVQADLGGSAGTYLFKVVDSSQNWLFTVHDSGTTAIHSGSLQIKEDVNAPAQVTAYGQLWVSGSTPNTLYFRNDAGADTQLGAGGGSAAGSDTQVQFNDGGSSFGGDAGLTYVKGTDTLTVASNININANLISGSSGHLQLYAADNVNLNSEAGITNFNYRGAETFRIAAGASSPVTLQPKASGYDLVLAAQDGTAVLHLDSTDKRIGIGTTNPSAKFSVTNAASQWAAYVDQNNTGNLAMKIEGNYGLGIETAGQFPLDISTASAADALRMLDNGNLGIGTTSPGALLDIHQNADDSALEIAGYDDKSGVTAKMHVASNGMAQFVGSSHTQVKATTDSVYISAAEHLYLDNGTRDTYSTIFRDGTGEYARFKNARLGIGTTNPDYPLDVYTAGTSFAARFTNTSNNGYIMKLVAADSSLSFQTDHIIPTYNMHLGNDNVNWYIRTAGKKLGVGTSSPATAFHVSGTNITSRFQDTTGVAFTDIKRIAVENSYAATVAGGQGQALGTTADAYTDIWTNKSRYISFRHATGSTTDGATTYMSGSRASSEYLKFKTTGNNYSKGGIISAPNELYIITESKDMSLNSANNLTTHYDKEYVIYNDTGNPVFHIRSGSSAAIEFEGDGDMRFKTTGTSTKMSLMSSGKVGIGTTGPDQYLHVKSGDTDQALKLESTDGNVDATFTDTGGSGIIRFTSNIFKFYTAADYSVNPLNINNADVEVTNALSVTGPTLAVQKTMKNDVSGDFTLSTSYSHYKIMAYTGEAPTNITVTITAPASPRIGDEYTIVTECGDSPAANPGFANQYTGTVRIIANTGQTINFVNTNINIDSRQSATLKYKMAKLICIDADAFALTISDVGPVA